MGNMGVKLALIRKQCGYSVGEAAELVGISRNTLTAYEYNKSVIPVSICIRLMHLYKCDIFDIYSVHTGDAEEQNLRDTLELKAAGAVWKEMKTELEYGKGCISSEYYKSRYKSYLKRYISELNGEEETSDEDIDNAAETLFNDEYIKKIFDEQQ